MSEWDRSISWTKLNTYDTCGRQFKYKYVDELEPDYDDDDTLRMDGINFHEYMELYYKVARDEPTEELAVDIAQEQFTEEQQYRYRPWIEYWHNYNVDLYDRFGEEHWKPVFLEEWVEVDISDHVHHGYLDAIRWDPEREEYGVVDYKRTAKRNSRLHGQLAYYADFLLERADLLDEEANWVGVYGYTTGEYKTWDVHWASRKATKKKIDSLVALESGYEANFGFHCKWCDFQEECWLDENEESTASSLL